MGLMDSLRAALGIGAEADATREADPEDLFQLSTGYVTMAADLGFEPTGEAALCFASMDSTDFAAALGDVEGILAAGEAETGTRYEVSEDGHGYSWVVLEDDDDFEDLVTSVNFAASEFSERGYGSRLLAAVFAFERERDGERAYWVYSFRRGSFYPFAPRGRNDRDAGVEFKLESVMDGELDVEAEKEYWYPLWPDAPNGHPWE